MKRIGLLACVPIISGLAFSCAQKPSEGNKAILPYHVVAPKSTVPIDLTLRFTAPPKVGAASEVECTVSPLMHASQIEVRLTFPPELSAQGECFWTQKMMLKGENKTLRAQCTIPDAKPYEIIATATIREGTARLTKVCSLLVGEAKPKSSQGQLKRNEKGERILEFQGTSR